MKTIQPSTQFLTDEKGNKIAVIIKWLDYQEIKENLHDLSVIAERKKEKTVSYEILKAKLKK